MTDDELSAAWRGYARRRPFRPYQLEFFSGEQVLIDHPEGIAPFNTLWLYRGPGRSRSVFTSRSVCRLLDISEAD